MHQNNDPMWRVPCVEGGSNRRRDRKGTVLIAFAAVVFILGFLAGRISALAAGAASIGPNPAAEAQARAESVITVGGSGSPAGAENTGAPPMTGSKEEEAWKVLLVNRNHPLPEDFVPETASVGNYRFDARAVGALNQMLAAAKAEGLSPIICSAYRSIERQRTLYEKQVKGHQDRGYPLAQAEALAGSVVAYPGTSEHNLGLAVDIVALSYQLLEEDQEATPESEWLHVNCHRFGFILRYPKDKQEITGIIYEPWHYRYVGVEAATEIMESGLSLEEYLGQG